MTVRAASRHARIPSLFWEVFEPRRLMAAGAPIDIEGVQNAALDQPRIHAYISLSPGGEPLVAEDPFFGETFDITAFFDTGASGVLISKETADALQVARATFNGAPVEFEDVGVGGSSFFDVSEPIYVSVAPYNPDADVDNPSTYDVVYDQTFGPLRGQISQEEADDLIGALDVFGMPLMAGKSVVMDVRPLNDFENLDVMRTYLYDPGTPFDEENAEIDPGIPQTDLHVKLSYAQFERFTSVTPAGAPGPTLRHNPFIGPNPILALEPGAPADDTPPIVIGHNGRTNSGSFLLDTGAAASMTIGGIGGFVKAAGFYMDSLAVPTVEGGPVRFVSAPVLVADIGVSDPDTGQELTLDGIFGMNFLVATAYVSDESPFPEDITSGPFDWLVFDESNGVLGLRTSDLLAVTAPTAVVDRHLFYNRSAFDNNDAAPTADDLAVAADKGPLLPGHTATPQNISSYTRGINGIMVDVANLPEGRTLAANDFVIRTGTTANPSGWATTVAPASVTVRESAGAGGSDRVTLTFADGAIRNRWVQVTVLANADTGLSSPDVFYFGNLVGETGDPTQTGTASTGAVDLVRLRGNLFTSPVSVTSRYDFNRDGRVSALDLGSLRGNLFQSLRLIAAPAGTGAAAGVASSDAVYLATSSRDRDPQSATQSLLAGV
jgi:hypothetical protein